MYSIQKQIDNKYKQWKRKNLCCACGSIECSQSTDHNKISLQYFQNLLQKDNKKIDKLQELKVNLKRIYTSIKQHILNQIQEDQLKMFELLSQYGFDRQFRNNVDMKIINQIMNHNLDLLPNRKIIKFQKIFRKQQSYKTNYLDEDVAQWINYVNNFNMDFIQKNIRKVLPYSQNEQKALSLPRLQQKRSISQISNPQQHQVLQVPKVYQWRNVRLTSLSRIVSLSNKNLSDRQMLQQMPYLSSFPNLQQFQIRNNRISQLTCNLLANNMSWLLSVDIRGNRIGDKGIIKIICGVKNMKSFSISQTQATDQTGKEVAKGLSNLEMFWSEQTQITGQVALAIAKKPKLKVLSFVKNPIQDQYKVEMRKIFLSKGYIAL